MLDYRPPKAPLIPWTIPINVYGVPLSRFSRGLPIRYLDEGYSPYSDGNYRRVTIENNEETFKEESNNEEVQVTKPHQVIDNIVSCSVLFDNAKHRLPQVGSQSYVDEILKKESSNLDIADEALPREPNREDVQANKEHVQVGTNLNILPVDIRVAQRAC